MEVCSEGRKAGQTTCCRLTCNLQTSGKEEKGKRAMYTLKNKSEKLKHRNFRKLRKSESGDPSCAMSLYETHILR